MANWRVLVYMVADAGDSFYQAAINDINEMAKADFGDNIEVVVHAHAPLPWATKTWLIQGTQGKKVGRVDELCDLRGQRKSLKSFLAWYRHWCMNRKPISEDDCCLLVLWGHGEGIDWEQKANVEDPPSSSFAGKRFAPGSQGSLSLAELEYILKDFPVKSENFVVGFDACLMGMIEVYYQIKERVGWVVACNDLLPETGWPYIEVLSEIGKEQNDTSAIVRRTVEVCVGWYNRKSRSSVAFSACNLNDTHDFRDALREFGKYLKVCLEDSRKTKIVAAINGALVKARDPQEEAYVDLNMFCFFMSRYLPDSTFSVETARAVLKALSPKSKFVRYCEFTDTYPVPLDEKSRALSICFPASADMSGSLAGIRVAPEAYEQLIFNRETSWYDFLKAYWTASSG